MLPAGVVKNIATVTRMQGHETINFRLSALEKATAGLVKSQSALAQSQIEMSADIRLLIKEQVRLTKVLEGIAGFQSDVRHMHTTQSRLFGRIERQERLLSRLNDEFNVYRAREDARRGVANWFVERWQFFAVVSAILAYGLYLFRELMK